MLKRVKSSHPSQQIETAAVKKFNFQFLAQKHCKAETYRKILQRECANKKKLHVFHIRTMVYDFQRESIFNLTRSNWKEMSWDAIEFHISDFEQCSTVDTPNILNFYRCLGSKCQKGFPNASHCACR